MNKMIKPVGRAVGFAAVVTVCGLALARVDGPGADGARMGVRRELMRAQLEARSIRVDAEGRPLASLCFVANPTDEEFDAIMTRWQAMPPPLVTGGIVDRYFTASPVWGPAGSTVSSGQGAPASVTYSFPPDGVVWGDGQNGPSSANTLNASLTTLFGAGNLDRGREYLRQSLASWRKVSGLTYTEVADDAAAYSTAYENVATRGNIRIGGNPQGRTGILAYNYFPGASDMAINTDYMTGGTELADPTNTYRYMRNVVAHEHGHGLGFIHPTPCNNTKLMEPFINTNFEMTQIDEMRGAGRNYGDRLSGNNSGASARDYGNLTTPAVRSIIERNISTNGVGGANGSGEDWLKFTLSSAQAVTITAAPTGGSYQNGQQTSGCNPTAPATVNASQAGNLNIELRNGTNGGTVLQTANTAAAGATETLSAGTLAAGTYWVRVVDAGPDSSGGQVVQLYDLTVRLGTSKAPPTAIAGIHKRVQAGTTAYFIGNLNSYANEAGATISTYAWDLDGDGVFEVANNPTPTTSYVSNGTYPVALRITDSNGLTATDTINCVVYGATTSVTGLTPATGNTGTTVPVTINGTNLKGVTLASQVTVSGGGMAVTGTPVANAAGTQVTGLSLVINTSAALGARNITITNSDGSGASGTGTGVFTVNSGVCVGAGIAGQPVSQTACAGDTAVISVTPSGSSPFTYQWKKNGSNIAGATSQSLTIAPVGPLDAASYSVAVTNACGSQTSAGATLSVNTPVTVSGQPASITRCAGTGASFSITASGSPAPTFQWRKGGNAIAGATSSTFSIASVVAADQGTYDCLVTNSCGSVPSSGATLTVTSGTTISVQPQPLTMCEGDSGTLFVTPAGSGPFTYRWRKNGVNVPGGTGISYSFGGASPSDSGNYDCVVTGPCGSVTSNTAAVLVRAAPAVTANPQPLTRCTGSGASFTVAATGDAPLSYQWRKSGGNIPGATAATYTIASVASGDAGSYDCLVTNACGQSVSTAAALSVNERPGITTQPVAQSLCEGAGMSLSVAATGTPAPTYQWRRGGTAIPGATGATYSVPAAGAADQGTYDCVVTNSCQSVTSAAVAVTVGARPVVTTPPTPQTPCPGSPASFTIAATGDAPLGYQWRKNGQPIVGATAGTYTLAAAAAADAGSYDCVVTNTCGSATSPAATLVLSDGPGITQQPQNQSACTGGSVTLTLQATGTAPIHYQWRRNGQDLASQIAASITLPSLTVADAGSYDCVVSNACGAATSDAAVVAIDAGPGISQQPAAAGVCAGDNASFSVVATGATGYQWLRGSTPLTDGPGAGGGAVSGATTATLSIAGVGPADAGSYACILTASCGSVTSNSAALSVAAGASITQQPVAQSACGGSPASFSVAATGGDPLSYQWRRNGSDIAGATGPAYTIASARPADAGSYDCVVTDPCRSVTSDAATLSVCVADFNCSALVSVQDIFDFIAAYFAGDPRSDINGSGAISVQDIFDFLAAYFTGCP